VCLAELLVACIHCYVQVKVLSVDGMFLDNCSTTAVAAALVTAAQALERAEAAQQRAAMAEQAKIELTLALAEAAEARAKDVDTHAHGGSSRRASAELQQGGDSAAAAAEDGEGWGDAGWSIEDAADSAADSTANPASSSGRARRTSAARARDSDSAAGVERVALPPGCTVVEAGEMEALLRRADEAELAAAVQTRRAAAAELELDGLKKRLADAEKQVG
jgi:hypothetical protein